MANGKDDIRVHVGWLNHPKTKRLRKVLEAEGPLSLLALWFYAAEHKPDGNLSGMAPDEIEAAADWNGKPGAFHEAILLCRWLDPDGMLHDWIEEQPWAANREARLATARENGRRGGLARAKRSAAHSGIVPNPSKPLSDSVSEPLSGIQPLLVLSSSASPTPEEQILTGEAPVRVGGEDPKPKHGPAEQVARDLAKVLGSGLPPCRKQVLALKEAGWDIDRIRGALPFAEPGMAPWDWTKLARTGGKTVSRFPDHAPKSPSSNGQLLAKIDEDRRRAAADLAAFQESGFTSRTEYLKHKNGTA